MLILFMISLTVGKADISWAEFLSAESSTDEVVVNLLYHFRLPKSITAILVGTALPIAGFLMQELFKNPLAEPSVLGVTSMSSLGVGIVIFLFSIMGLEGLLNQSWIIILASFLGALLALSLILSFAQKIKSSASLIILGFMLSGLTIALVSLMQYFAPSDQIKTF
jgi:ABC-type cobalamin transport system, permease component